MDYLTPSLQAFLRMIDEGNPLGMVLLTLALLFLGDTAAKSRPKAQRLGAYAAALTSTFYTVYALAAYGRMEPVCLLGILWRALLAAGVAYGAAALTAAVAAALVGPPGETFSRCIDRNVRAVADRRDARRRRREEHARLAAMAEQERLLAPLREQQQRDAEAADRRRAELEVLRRRLRFDCQLGYNRLRPAVVEMFPQQEFGRLVDEALRVEAEADLRRGVKDLMDTVQAVVGSQGDGGVESLMEVARDFDNRRAAVQDSDYSDERKDDLVKYLNLQEEIQIRKVLEQ